MKSLKMFQFLFLFFFLISISIVSGEDDFIRLSCNSTLYPQLCYQVLSPYNQTIQASPSAMALTALNISLESTKTASHMVLQISKANKLSKREAGAVADCVETVEDAVEELQQSIVAMRDLEGPEFQFKVSNIQTWVSAALTDDNTCMDGIDEKEVVALATSSKKVKRRIRSEIVNVAQLTSVALALVNKLTSA
ncbi:hypothetical protein QQ045_008750 [Rhodiola kirilowii]